MQVAAVAAAGPGSDVAQAAMLDLSFGINRLVVGGACGQLAELALLLAWCCCSPVTCCPGISTNTAPACCALYSAVLLLEHAVWSGACRHVLLATEWCRQVNVR